jgi:hypothetical protein
MANKEILTPVETNQKQESETSETCETQSNENNSVDSNTLLPLPVNESEEEDEMEMLPIAPLADPDEDEENIIHLTPEEEAKLRRDFGYVANVLKKNLCIIVQEVTFPNDPRGDIIIDHSFKPESDENGIVREVKYSMLFWKSGLNHRRSIPPEHAILIILSLLENHETTPQFMFECGQNIKVAYGQLPTNLWAFAILISRLEDMDYDEIVPDESELSTRKRYRDTYHKFVLHFRKIARDIIEAKGRSIPVNPELVDSDLEDNDNEVKEKQDIEVKSEVKTERRGRPKKSTDSKDVVTDQKNTKEPKVPKVPKEPKKAKPVKVPATNKASTDGEKKRGRPKKVSAV